MKLDIRLILIDTLSKRRRHNPEVWGRTWLLSTRSVFRKGETSEKTIGWSDHSVLKKISRRHSRNRHERSILISITDWHINWTSQKFPSLNITRKDISSRLSLKPIIDVLPTYSSTYVFTYRISFFSSVWETTKIFGKWPILNISTS